MFLYLATPDGEGRQEAADGENIDFGGRWGEVLEGGPYVYLGLLHADGRDQRGIGKQLFSSKKRK